MKLKKLLLASALAMRLGMTTAAYADGSGFDIGVYCTMTYYPDATATTDCEARLCIATHPWPDQSGFNACMVKATQATIAIVM